MQCSKCGKGELARSKRQGWVERQIYTRLGLYPWLCRECKARFLLRVREEKNDKPLPIWVD